MKRNNSSTQQREMLEDKKEKLKRQSLEAFRMCLKCEIKFMSKSNENRMCWKCIEKTKHYHTENQ